VTVCGRPLLFYSAWPLAYHNVEALRKATGLAGKGYDVTYVAGVGTRNPTPSSAAKLADRVVGKVRDRATTSTRRRDDSGLRTASVLVLPPRQVPPVRRFNAMWLERQLRRSIPAWDEAVAWIRWPTPELVDALTRLAPALTVYECLDAYHDTPGIRGRWATIHEEAERKLVGQAAMVVVPGEVLAARFRAWGAPVRVVPHGVDPFPAPSGARRAGVPVIGFVGTLDYRLDIAVLRAIAGAGHRWTLRLVGPVQEGFDPTALTDLPNVSVEPPVPHDRLGRLLEEFDVGVMPYADTPIYRAMTPVKTLELMAAGCPAVARPSTALDPYRDLLYLADSPEEFVLAVERALSEDSPELAGRRRAIAATHSWDSRIDELGAVLADLLARPGH